MNFQQVNRSETYRRIIRARPNITVLEMRLELERENGAILTETHVRRQMERVRVEIQIEAWLLEHGLGYSVNRVHRYLQSAGIAATRWQVIEVMTNLGRQV